MHLERHHLKPYTGCADTPASHKNFSAKRILLLFKRLFHVRKCTVLYRNLSRVTTQRISKNGMPSKGTDFYLTRSSSPIWEGKQPVRHTARNRSLKTHPGLRCFFPNNFLILVAACCFRVMQVNKEMPNHRHLSHSCWRVQRLRQLRTVTSQFP